MFTSATAAPLPSHPIGLGLSDSPSMSAYITTGSPGSDTNNSQLVWKQSANLPDPDLLKHLCEVTFLTHASTSEFTLIFQGRCLLRVSSSCKPAVTSAHIPFVGTPFSSLLCGVPLTHMRSIVTFHYRRPIQSTLVPPFCTLYAPWLVFIPPLCPTLAYMEPKVSQEAGL